MRAAFPTRLFLVLGLAAAVAGCMNQPPPKIPVAAGEEPNPIRITTAPVSHLVHFASGVASLSSEEMLSLRAFLYKEEAHPGETLTVATGAGSLADARRNRVIALLHQDGYETAFGASLKPLQDDGVAVTLMRKTVVLPHCPNWPQFGGNEPFNLPSSNLGCTTAVDLAVMVADPQDLVSGRTPGPENSEPGVRAVESYRAGKQPAEEHAAGASPAAAGVSGGATTGGGNAQ